MSKEIEEWFIKEFWPNYPGKFCGRGKGSRGIALRHMLKIKPDADERVRILDNLKAQVRAHSQKPPEQRNYWKIGETYVYNRLWNDEIESVMEAKQAQKLSICSVDNCTSPVHGSSFSMCTDHVPSDWDDRLRQAWKETGLDRKSKTMRADCLAYITKLGYGKYVG